MAAFHKGRKIAANAWLKRQKPVHKGAGKLAFAKAFRYNGGTRFLFERM